MLDEKIQESASRREGEEIEEIRTDNEWIFVSPPFKFINTEDINPADAEKINNAINAIADGLLNEMPAPPLEPIRMSRKKLKGNKPRYSREDAVEIALQVVIKWYGLVVAAGRTDSDENLYHKLNPPAFKVLNDLRETEAFYAILANAFFKNENLIQEIEDLINILQAEVALYAEEAIKKAKEFLENYLYTSIYEEIAGANVSDLIDEFVNKYLSDQGKDMLIDLCDPKGIEVLLDELCTDWVRLIKDTLELEAFLSLFNDEKRALIKEELERRAGMRWTDCYKFLMSRGILHEVDKRISEVGEKVLANLRTLAKSIDAVFSYKGSYMRVGSVSKDADILLEERYSFFQDVIERQREKVQGCQVRRIFAFLKEYVSYYVVYRLVARSFEMASDAERELILKAIHGVGEDEDEESIFQEKVQDLEPTLLRQLHSAGGSYSVHVKHELRGMTKNISDIPLKNAEILKEYNDEMFRTINSLTESRAIPPFCKRIEVGDIFNEPKGESAVFAFYDPRFFYPEDEVEDVSDSVAFIAVTCRPKGRDKFKGIIGSIPESCKAMLDLSGKIAIKEGGFTCKIDKRKGDIFPADALFHSLKTQCVDIGKPNLYERIRFEILSAIFSVLTEKVFDNSFMLGRHHADLTPDIGLKWFLESEHKSPFSDPSFEYCIDFDEINLPDQSKKALLQIQDNIKKAQPSEIAEYERQGGQSEEEEMEVPKEEPEPPQKQDEVSGNFGQNNNRNGEGDRQERPTYKGPIQDTTLNSVLNNLKELGFHLVKGDVGSHSTLHFERREEHFTLTTAIKKVDSRTGGRITMQNLKHLLDDLGISY